MIKTLKNYECNFMNCNRMTLTLLSATNFILKLSVCYAPHLIKYQSKTPNWIIINRSGSIIKQNYNLCVLINCINILFYVY